MRVWNEWNAWDANEKMGCVVLSLLTVGCFVMLVWVSTVR
jgi:hypothetical protein